MGSGERRKRSTTTVSHQLVEAARLTCDDGIDVVEAHGYGSQARRGRLWVLGGCRLGRAGAYLLVSIFPVPDLT